ncbi:MAG: hypothetical protein R8K47_03650 [Mariprofundaceae bacterium]
MTLKARWFAPRQIILIDPDGQRPATKRVLRPARWLAGLLALFLAGLLAGAWLATGEDQRAEATIAHLKQQADRLKQALAGAEAELDVAHSEQASLHEELAKARARIAELDARLRMFDSILAARKQPGAHVLKPRARWDENGRIIVELILVKGGNYPRSMAGKLRFLAVDTDGEPIPLRLEDGSDALSWLVKTHTFLRTAIDWHESWRPERITLVLADRREREIERTTISIGGNP